MSKPPKGDAKGRGKPRPFSHVRSEDDLRAMNDEQWAEYKRQVDKEYLEGAMTLAKSRTAAGIQMGLYHKRLAKWRFEGSQGRPPSPPYETRLPSFKQRDFLRQLLNHPNERSVMAFLDFATASPPGYGYHPDLRPHGKFFYGARQWQQGIALLVNGRNTHGGWADLHAALEGLPRLPASGRADLVEAVDGRWVFLPRGGALCDASRQDGGASTPAIHCEVNKVDESKSAQRKVLYNGDGIQLGRMTIEELEAAIGDAPGID